MKFLLKLGEHFPGIRFLYFMRAASCRIKNGVMLEKEKATQVHGKRLSNTSIQCESKKAYQENLHRQQRLRAKFYPNLE